MGRAVCSRLFDLTALRAESKPSEPRHAVETKPLEKAPLTLGMQWFDACVGYQGRQNL